jgi:glycosyltransferase involved in cell wall biosynthesis
VTRGIVDADSSPRPLNIVQICDHLGWPGSRMHGVKRLFGWMIPRFDPDRFKVSLISLRAPDTSEDPLEALGIDVTYLNRSKFDPTTLPALLRVLDEKRADVLHLHGYGATTFGRLAAAWRGLPTLLHEHANLTDTPWFQKVADRLLAPYTDLAIAVSRSTAEFVSNERLVPEERTRVVYLGAPTEEFSIRRTPDEIRATRAALGMPTDGTVVGTVTRLMPSKGNQYFVEAARAILDREPETRFCIVGEGELKEDLEAQARALGLGDRLRFAGFTRDVAGALAAFDVVVFPSLWEGTPLTAFEALASGRPIVASDADGLGDILHHGRDSIVVPKRDSAGLADAVVALLRDRDRREQIAAEARVTGAGYDIRVFVQKMERLYVLMHETLCRTGVSKADLGFLLDTTYP